MKKDQIKMTMKDKRKYISNIARRYHRSDKVKKGLILDELCETFELSRCYAIRVMNKGHKRARKKPGRASRYQSPEFIKGLKQIWFCSDWACGKLLKSAIPLVLPHLESRHQSAV